MRKPIEIGITERNGETMKLKKGIALALSLILVLALVFFRLH